MIAASCLTVYAGDVRGVGCVVAVVDVANRSSAALLRFRPPVSCSSTAPASRPSPPPSPPAAPADASVSNHRMPQEMCSVLAAAGVLVNAAHSSSLTQHQQQPQPAAAWANLPPPASANMSHSDKADQECQWLSSPHTFTRHLEPWRIARCCDGDNGSGSIVGLAMCARGAGDGALLMAFRRSLCWFAMSGP